MSDLRITRGDDGVFDSIVYQADRITPQNVTDYGFTATVKAAIADEDPGLWQGVFTPPNDPNGVRIVDAEAGLVSIEIPASVTELWEPAALLWDLQLTTPDGKVRTVDRGRLTVVADVTRA